MRPLKNAQFCSRFKEGKNSNPPDHHRDRQEYLGVFRGLEFEPDTEIGQKGGVFQRSQDQ